MVSRRGHASKTDISSCIRAFLSLVVYPTARLNRVKAGLHFIVD